MKKAAGLRDYLRWQSGVSDFSCDERICAEWIIENIDDNGYLSTTLEEISQMSAIPVAALEGALKKVQKLDPAGVGARDLRECLLIQYAETGEKDEIFEDVVNNHFDLFKEVGP